MDTLDKDCAAGFMDHCLPPCLSLYQPTHRHYQHKLQDAILFRHLLQRLEESLLRQLPKEAVRPSLEPFLALAEDRDFWSHTREGLAVLGAHGLFRVYRLQRPVPELAVVADSLHLKPLLRILQSADRYHILALNDQAIQLFEGNRDALDEIEPSRNVPRTIIQVLGEDLPEPHQTRAPGGGTGQGNSPLPRGPGGRAPELASDEQRFFRAVDRAVWEHHSQPSGLPLILAALPEHHRLFHQGSVNSLLQPEGIASHPEALASLDELRQRAWQLVEPRYQARLAALVAEFGDAKAKGRADDDLASVARAVVGGRVATLLIEAPRAFSGRIDAASGDLTFGDLAQAGVDDVLDDLGTLTLKRGGQVVVVPTEGMPTETGIAAIYRS